MIFSIKEKKYPQVNSRRVINRFAWLPTIVLHLESGAGPKYWIWLESYRVSQVFVGYYWKDQVKFLSEKSFSKIMSKTINAISKSLNLHI